MNHPDGKLIGMDRTDIALEAGWIGDPDQFVDALISCKLLDEVDGWYCLHDWKDHQPYVCGADFRADRARKAAAARYGKYGGSKAKCPENANSTQQALLSTESSNAPSPSPSPSPKPKPKCVLCETDTETAESQPQPEPQHCAATAARHANNGRFLLTSKKHKLTGWKLEGFKEFWEAFADKRSRAAAAESWRCIPDLSPGLIREIVEGALRYARDRPGIVSAKGTPKMAQGWLTDRRWEDEKSEHGETEDLVAYLENKYGTEDAAKGVTQ